MICVCRQERERERDGRNGLAALVHRHLPSTQYASDDDAQTHSLVTATMRSIVVVFFTVQIILVIYAHLAMRTRAQMMSHVI